MTHNDVSRAEFGYVAEPREFGLRASDAAALARIHSDGDATHFADIYLEDPAGWNVPIAAEYYAKSRAGVVYARAVYEVVQAAIRERVTA